VGRNGSASGVAVDPGTKAPLANAPILCDDGPCGWDADGLWPAVTTDAKGRFEVRDLAPGRHRLRVGQTTTIDVTVSPAMPSAGP
jgi:hypothetical protein